MILKGRRKIVTEFTGEQIVADPQALIDAIRSTYMVHIQNRNEIEYLINYKNGIQPILYKEKEVRPEINNKIVVNNAQMITRTITGYFLGTPIQYVQSTADKKDQIELLNRIVDYEDKSSVDKEISDMQSICGTAYRIIFSDGVYADEVPFEDKLLNPMSTYVAYANDISERPVMGVTYLDLLDENGNLSGRKFYVYTDFGMYSCVTDYEGVPTLQTEFDFVPYSIGGIPIIEYPNNIWRIGDWELCIGIMNAVNELQSGRLDDVQQVVQSLLVFINADIDAKTYDEMRASGVVVLKNTTSNPSSVDTIQNSLDQSSSNVFAKELEELIYALIGIPDRNNRAGGGGDTGQAVELRDGWADLEIVARNKELTFKRSEKQALKIMLNIINSKMGTDLSLLDINIKFSRNKNNNLLVKTQAYMNLMQTKTLDPADCLTIVDLVSDVNDFIERGKSFWGDEFAMKTPKAEETTTTEPNENTNTEKENENGNQEKGTGNEQKENTGKETGNSEENTGDEEKRK